MGSLRVRLVLLTLTVVAVALASVALFSRRAVRSEYLRLEVQQRDDRLASTAAALGRLGSSPEADALLTRAATAGHGLAWIAADGRVLAVSDPSLRDAVVALDGDSLVVERTEEVDGHAARRRMKLVGGPRAVVLAPDGRPAGHLIAIPAPRDEAGGEPGFVAAVNRRLWLAAAASLLLALALALLLSRQIARPVAALTAAARRMAGGDLAARVVPAGGGELSELAQAFNAMADAVGRAEGLRRALVADVAHELRTPLTNLRCQIEAVQDGLQPADAATLGSLHEETLLLARLVGDLQDLALAESGQLPIHVAALPIRDALESAAAAVRPLAAERGVEVSVAAAGDVVVADRERLAQVLRNLLANALTHTPPGGRVRLEAAPRDGHVEVVVADTGPGIPPEHLPHVFDRFHRADPSRARATGGAGLGLAIVRQLVLAHGGEVSAANAPGGGARVAFTLPRG